MHNNILFLLILTQLLVGCGLARSISIIRGMNKLELHQSKESVKEALGEPDRVELLGEPKWVDSIEGSISRLSYRDYWVYFADNKLIHTSDSSLPRQETDDFLKLGLINKDEYYKRREVEALEEANRLAEEANRQSRSRDFDSFMEGIGPTRTSCSPNIFGGFDCTSD